MEFHFPTEIFILVIRRVTRKTCKVKFKFEGSFCNFELFLSIYRY